MHEVGERVVAEAQRHCAALGGPVEPDDHGFRWTFHTLEQRVRWEPATARRSDAVAWVRADIPAVTGIRDIEGARRRLATLGREAVLSAPVLEGDSLVHRLSMLVVESTIDWCIEAFKCALELQHVMAKHDAVEIVAEHGGRPLDQEPKLWVPVGGRLRGPAFLEDVAVEDDLFQRASALHNGHSKADLSKVQDGVLLALAPCPGPPWFTMEARRDSPHPDLGEGMLIALYCPVEVSPEMIADLNQEEASQGITGPDAGDDLPSWAHLMGSWCIAPNTEQLAYVSFFPPALMNAETILQHLLSNSYRALWIWERFKRRTQTL